MTLSEKILELHGALERAELPHAFGGALALAYWTLDPRGTSDIDVNVFVPESRARVVLSALPAAVTADDAATRALRETGQARLWWGESPVDVFLDYLPLHARAAENHRTVPFAGRQIPVLGPVELAVFKAMFDRTRDWADLEAMAAAGTLDVDAVRVQLRELVPDDDPRHVRVEEAGRRGREGQA